MKTEQQIINEIAVEQLKLAMDSCPHCALVHFAEQKIKETQAGNSNWSYEDCNRVLQWNGDEKIKWEEIVGEINRAVRKVKLCFSKRFIWENKNRLKKTIEKGQFDKLAVLILIQDILSKF